MLTPGSPRRGATKTWCGTRPLPSGAGKKATVSMAFTFRERKFERRTSMKWHSKLQVPTRGEWGNQGLWHEPQGAPLRKPRVGWLDLGSRPQSKRLRQTQRESRNSGSRGLQLGFLKETKGHQELQAHLLPFCGQFALLGTQPTEKLFQSKSSPLCCQLL